MNPENYPKQDSIESRIIRPIPIFSRKTHSFFVEPRITNDSTIHLSIPKKKRIQKNKAINIRNTSHLHVDKQPNQEPQENKDNREDKSPVYLSNKLKIFLSHNEYMSDESRWISDLFHSKREVISEKQSDKLTSHKRTGKLVSLYTNIDFVKMVSNIRSYWRRSNKQTVNIFKYRKKTVYEITGERLYNDLTDLSFIKTMNLVKQ